MAVEAEQRTSLVLKRKTRSVEHVLLSSKGTHQREMEAKEKRLLPKNLFFNIRVSSPIHYSKKPSMLKKKKKQSVSMEDHGDGIGKKQEVFDMIEYEVSSALLELSHPVVFSSDSFPLFHKWGRTKKRSSSLHSHPPLIKSVGDMGSNSSSSCLTGEAKKPNSQTAEMGLLRAQVGLVAQPISDGHYLVRHLQPFISVDRTVNVRDVELRMEERRGFDLNLPAAEEGNRIVPMVGFQRVAAAASSKVQAAAQARQRRLGLIRSKKLYTRFISSYQLK
ncbi:hypothetical protein CARUB_v10020709mg [Capsella rubella]|uniref:Uncharacterized protein n=1 Tax=Capsella rubella TaxID=81985 RepID=R0GIH0_9BRAS|nr:hypothetical protein CARUB_v10020709mg [Capsella rubella]